METCNIFHDVLDLESLESQHMSCTNVNAKKKEYVHCVTDPKTDLKFCYTQLYYCKKPQFIVTTPPMICPFGINSQNNNFKSVFNLNYKSDNVMNSFYDFIQTWYKQICLGVR